jgi:hypothetical protein
MYVIKPYVINTSTIGIIFNLVGSTELFLNLETVLDSFVGYRMAFIRPKKTGPRFPFPTLSVLTAGKIVSGCC